MRRRADERSIALVLQGGGARGAYQAGVIKAIAGMDEAGENPFRILCGTSVGALNAAALAAGAMDFRAAAGALETLWRGLSSDSIYATDASTLIVANVARLARSALGRPRAPGGGSVLDNGPYRALLQRAFDHRDVARSIRHGALDALCITASSYTVGRAVTFYETSDDIDEWHRVRRDGARTSIGVEHLLASSALPFVFPSVCIDGCHYGDGALRLRAPLSPAIRMGAAAILAIGVRDPVPDVGAATPCSSAVPSTGAIGGHLLDIVFNDSLDADIERLLRINETLRLLPPAALPSTSLRPVEVLTLYPSRDLRTLAETYRDELPRSVRLLLRKVGAGQSHGQLLSYLSFESGFIHSLIELGHADTLARREAIVAFLSGR